jgi:hypothetical protein
MKLRLGKLNIRIKKPSGRYSIIPLFLSLSQLSLAIGKTGKTSKDGKDMKCSLCGKNSRPDSIWQLSLSYKLRLCNECTSRFYQAFATL